MKTALGIVFLSLAGIIFLGISLVMSDGSIHPIVLR